MNENFIIQIYFLLLMKRAGTPAQISHGGMFLVTTLPAPIIAP
jgi:hypothetical protein